MLLLVNMYKRVLHSIDDLANIAGKVEPIAVIALESINALYNETIAYGVHVMTKPNM